MKDFLVSVFGPIKEGVGVRVKAGKRAVLVTPEHVASLRANVTLPAGDKGVSLDFRPRGDDLCIAGPLRGPGLSLRQKPIEPYDVFTAYTPRGSQAPQSSCLLTLVDENSRASIQNLAPGCNPNQHLLVKSSLSPIVPGMSGSPVVDNDGNLVGVVVKVSRSDPKIGLVRLVTPRDVEWQD